MAEAPFTIMAAGCDLPGRPAELSPDEAAARRGVKSGLCWMHILAHDELETTRFLVDELGFRPLDVQLTFDPLSTADVHDRDDVLFVEVPAAVPGSDGEEYVEVGFFLSKGSLVSVSTAPVPVLLQRFEEWKGRTVRKGETAAGILHDVLDAIVDGYFPISDSIQAEIDELEDLIYEGRQMDVRMALRIKQRLLGFRRRIAPIRDGVNALLRRNHDLVPRDLWPYFHDVYDHALRLVEVTDLARDIVSTILDAHLGIVSNRLSEIMRFLAAISTILMSVTLISSVYGMNFRHMPELNQPWGYAAALIFMATVGLVEWLLFKRKKWV